MSSERDEVSAGGVVVRGADTIVIVPRRRDADGRPVLGLPKGHLDGDESPEQAAAREVREEAGVEARLVEKLGDVHYFYQRSGRRIAKRVSFFLFDYVSGDTAEHDHEVEEARWVPLEEAARTLTYKGERDMAARALSRRPPAR
jgi:8-oxo-dGTP pyrophosphatase MutT (NUDIX family)